MKKYFLLASLAALLPLLCCTKNPENNNNNPNENQPAEVTPPAFSASAMKMAVDETGIAQTGVKSIECSEDGRYTVFRKVTLKADTSEAEEYITGAYTVSGKVYTLEGFGQVEVLDNGQIVITPVSGSPVTVKATSQPAVLPENDLTTFMCRAWKLEQIDVTLQGSGIPVSPGVTKKGNDIYAIASEVNSNYKLDFDLEPINGMVVKCINLSKFGTLTLEFTNQEKFPSFVADYTLNGENFSYEFVGDQEGNEIIQAQATGKVIHKADDTLWLVVNAKGQNGGDTYSGTITFVLSKLNS